MGRFALSCPKCGNYVTAYNGIMGLFKNKIQCECGNEIDVRTERMSAVKCPHCGNSVIYDQGKKDADCPVCKKKIEAGTSRKMRAFHCPQCGVGLTAAEGARDFECPVCDKKIDVSEAMAKEKIKTEGLISEIKYEGDNSTLVWKHPIEDFRTGSQLIVHESQEAIFFRDGEALDGFDRAGRYTLETQNLPLLDKMYKIPSGGNDIFHSEVYYINKVTIGGIKWGTDSKVRVTEPTSGIPLELGASGEFFIKVSNARKLLFNLVGTNSTLSKDALLSTSLPESSALATGGESLNSGGSGVSNTNRSNTNMQGFFRTMIMTQVKAFLAKAIRANHIPVLEIDEHLMELSEALGRIINLELERYGLTVERFYIARIATPDNDPNWKMLKQQKADIYLKIKEEEIRAQEAKARADRKFVEAETAAQINIIGARGKAEADRLKAQGEAEAYRLKAEAEAREMQMKGYTYGDETRRKVGMESMKHGLTGNGGGGGSNLTGDLLGLGVGIAAMKNVGEISRDALSALSGENDSDHGTGGNLPLMQKKFWNCPKCKKNGLTGSFCDQCGGAKPEEKKTWDCPKCGNTGLTGNFCDLCGGAKPEEKKTWDCPKCGNTGLTGNFCNQCGGAKPEEKKTWDCPMCGKSGLTGNFCDICGESKPGEDKPEEPGTWDCTECGHKDNTGNFCDHCGTSKEK